MSRIPGKHLYPEGGVTGHHIFDLVGILVELQADVIHCIIFVFVILAINMVLAFVLLFASVKINCMNIRNAAKMELNNVSARIYADTFHSQREANLDSH